MLLTGKTKAGFHPLLPGFVHAEFNNLDSFREVVDESTAAIFVEPVQGGAGSGQLLRNFFKVCVNLRPDWCIAASR